jgi:hypothetical protein
VACATLAGCGPTTCSEPSCAQAVTISIYQQGGAPLADGDWTATVTSGLSKGTARGTIKNGQLVSNDGFNELDVQGRVQELYVTLTGLARPAATIVVTHDAATVASQTFDPIVYDTSVANGCGGSCPVAQEKLPLP